MNASEVEFRFAYHERDLLWSARPFAPSACARVARWGIRRLLAAAGSSSGSSNPSPPEATR